MENTFPANALGKEEKIQMRIVGIYSFNQGKAIIESKFGFELREIEQVIASIDSRKHKTKVSKEKTMPGKMLYKPSSLNNAKRLNHVAGISIKSIVNILPSSTLEDTSQMLHRAVRFAKWILSKTELELRFNLANTLLWSITLRQK